MNPIARALAISRKDVESYYAKPPLVSWGLLFPAVLTLAVYVRDRSSHLALAPGAISMALLFGATSMAVVAITFEKRSGTFERLLLAPLAARTIVVGKAAGAAAYGLATSGTLALGLVAFAGMPLRRPDVFATGLLLGAWTFALLGILASVLVKEVFEAMALMNFLRFPLLFVSGVFVPLSEMPAWIRPVAYLSPLTHVVELLRFGTAGEGHFSTPWVPLGAAAFFLAASTHLAVRALGRFATR